MPATTDKLDTSLQEKVLTKLGFSSSPSIDFSGLQSIYSAWCKSVPFDNIRKVIHIHNKDQSTLPGDEAPDFFQAWLKHGTGGTCWSGNGALQTLLSSLGFTAVRGVGTMMLAQNLPPNHGTVLVILAGERYLVDASILHNLPLPLKDKATLNDHHPAADVLVENVGGLWHIRWRPLHMPDGLTCRIDLLETSKEDFHFRHEGTRTWSPFNYELCLRLVTNDTVSGIWKGQHVVLSEGRKETITDVSDSDRIGILVNEFGISEEMASKLPKDRPTPPPPDSDTARLSMANAGQSH